MKFIPRHLLPCALLLLLAGCSTKSKRAQVAPKPLEIKVQQVVVDQIATHRTFTSQAYGQHEIDLQPRVSGYLKSVHYQEGGDVKRGELLITIDNTQYLAAVADARAALSSAQAQRIQAQSRVNRYTPLSKRKAISQSSLEDAKATLEEARSSVNSAKANITNATANLSYTKLYAPFDGVIGETRGAVGEYVGVGTEYTVVNTLSKVDSICVKLSIPSQQYIDMALAAGVRQEIYSDAELLSNITLYLPNGEPYPHAGIYDFTQRAINDQTGSVVVEVLFPNPDRLLKPGEYVTVVAEVGALREALLVPAKSVMQSQGVNALFTTDSSGVVKYQQVVLGENLGELWEIKSGVAPTDLILTEGLMKVHSGEKIKPIITQNNMRPAKSL